MKKKNFLLYFNNSFLFRLLLSIVVFFLFFIADAYFGEILYCSDADGDIPDLLDSDAEEYSKLDEERQDVFELR